MILLVVLHGKDVVKIGVLYVVKNYVNNGIQMNYTIWKIDFIINYVVLQWPRKIMKNMNMNIVNVNFYDFSNIT